MLWGARPESFGDPSFARVASEVASGVFFYDLLFYPFHLSFHRAKLPAWRKQHRRHHVWSREESAAHNAVETVQNSYLDAGIQVAINIAVQAAPIYPWGYKHPLSRALHNLMVVYLLCEAHSGYDLPFMSHRLLPGVLGGPVRHEAHHRHGGVCFHQFFTYIDDACGFAPPEPRARRKKAAVTPAVDEAARRGADERRREVV